MPIVAQLLFTGITFILFLLHVWLLFEGLEDHALGIISGLRPALNFIIAVLLISAIAWMWFPDQNENCTHPCMTCAYPRVIHDECITKSKK